MKGKKRRSTWPFLAALPAVLLAVFLVAFPCRAAPEAPSQPGGAKTPEQIFRETAEGAEGNPAAALGTYLELKRKGFSSSDLERAIQRLSARAIRVDGMYLFPPDRWEKKGDFFVNPGGSERITFSTGPAGDPGEVSRKSAANAMPPGMFSDENLKNYENMRKMAEEIRKAAPEVAEGMKVSALPLLETKRVTEKMGGTMVLASTSGTVVPGTQSACALAFRSGEKNYVLTWVAYGAAPEKGGEALLKLLGSLLSPP